MIDCSFTSLPLLLSIYCLTYNFKQLPSYSQFVDENEYLFICYSQTGVTILLSLMVFLLLVAETMPPTSDAVPLIGKLHRLDFNDSFIFIRIHDWYFHPPKPHIMIISLINVEKFEHKPYGAPIQLIRMGSISVDHLIVITMSNVRYR